MKQGSVSIAEAIRSSVETGILAGLTEATKAVLCGDSEIPPPAAPLSRERADGGVGQRSPRGSA